MDFNWYKVENPITADKLPFDINNIAAAGITNFYVGKDDCCRCGCGGKYYRPESKMWKRMLTQFRKLVENGCIRSVDGDGKPYWNVAFGDRYDNKCYCFYTD